MNRKQLVLPNKANLCPHFLKLFYLCSYFQHNGVVWFDLFIFNHGQPSFKAAVSRSGGRLK